MSSTTVPDERTGGPHFAAFCERYLVHTKGRWSRRPLLLEPWQREFWWEAMEVDPGTGLRVYSEVGLGLPRKNGKSTIASGLGLYCLLADGENEPEVYVGAGAQQQAGIVMGQSIRMARMSPMLYPSQVRVLQGAYRIEAHRNGGVMRWLSSDGALQHGLNPSCSIIDEVHAHKSPDLYTALTTGTGAREQPLTLWITTAGEDDDNLLSDLVGQMYSGQGELEQRGPSLVVYRDREAGTLVYWYGAPKDADVEDPRLWGTWNPASWLQDGQVLGRALASLRAKGKMLEWRIYHCNQIMATETSWLPDGSWGSLVDGEPDDDPWHDLDPDLPVGVGIERAPMSKSGAIVVVQRQGDKAVVRPAHFPPAPDTGRVDVRRMEDVLMSIRSRFTRPMVRDPKSRIPIAGPAFAFDPVHFQEQADDLDRQGLNMVAMPQTAGGMAPASTLTYELVTQGRLVHDGDPILARHVLDSEALLTDRGMRVIKGSRRPNPSCIAMVMAVAMAMQEPPKPFVRSARQAAGF